MYLLTFATNNKNPLNFPNQILIPLWHVSVVLGGQIGSGRVGGYNLYIHQLFVFCCCFFLFNVYLFYLLFWFWTIALVFLSFVCCSPVVVAVVVCYCVITVFSSIVVCIHTQHKIVVIISPLSIFFSSPFIITIFYLFL